MKSNRMLLIASMAIFGISVYLGLKVYHKSKDSEIKIISLGLTLGLISYYISNME